MELAEGLAELTVVSPFSRWAWIPLPPAPGAAMEPLPTVCDLDDDAVAGLIKLYTENSN